MYQSRPFFLRSANANGWTLKELQKDDFVKQHCPKKTTKHKIFEILQHHNKIEPLTDIDTPELTEELSEQLEELMIEPETATVIPPPEVSRPTATDDTAIYLQCVRHKGRLRVRVYNHRLYHPNINCQFPRDLREDGKFFKVTSLKIAHGPKGTVFYRANPKDIMPLNQAPDVKIVVYEDKDVRECIVCFCNDKDVVFVPCGHYNCCAKCYNRLPTKKCPTCRGGITSILRAEDIVSEE